MATSPLPYITPDQYLRTERAAEYKSEYIDGVVYAMSGGTIYHSQIAAAMIAALRNRVRGRGCTVFTSDMQVAITPKGPFVYPDLSVACGERTLLDGRNDLLTDPLLIVEVLSPSSEAYDRGKKFALYRKIQSLREYVLISQSEPRAETFLRESTGEWTLAENVGIDALCRFRSLNLDVPLAEIYEDVRFPEQSSSDSAPDHSLQFPLGDSGTDK